MMSPVSMSVHMWWGPKAQWFISRTSLIYSMPMISLGVKVN